jgi:hypothetical protein
MVFKYKRKRMPKYNPQQLEDAIKAVYNGSSLRQASQSFEIPLATLHDHVSGRHVGHHGHDTVLTRVEEETIVSALQYSAQYGWPCSRNDLRKMVKDFCDLEKRDVPWGPDGPGKDFLQGFDRRWDTSICKRKAELLTTSAARGLNKKVLQDFFLKVENLYNTYQLHSHPERVFNLDETGLNTNAGISSSYFKKGTKSAIFLNPTAGKTQYTVLVCGNASGEVLPPFVVYKAQNLYNSWCLGGPDGTQYGRTPSGWMEGFIFEEWMERVSTIGHRF